MRAGHTERAPATRMGAGPVPPGGAGARQGSILGGYLGDCQTGLPLSMLIDATDWHVEGESDRGCETRSAGLADHRALLRARLRNGDLGQRARAVPQHLGGLFFGRAQRRLVRHRGLAVRLQHRLRAPGGSGGHRRRQRPGGRAVRDPGLTDPAAAGLGLRAVLSQERRLHDAGVPRAPLLKGRPLLPGGDLHRGLRADQDLGHHRRGGRRLRGPDGDQLLDRGAGRGGGHGDLHRLRWAQGGALHRHAADVRADRRLGDGDRNRRGPARRGRAADRRRGARLPQPLEADLRSELPLDRHPLRRADPGRLVLVHRSVHRAAGAVGRERGPGATGDDLRRVPQAAAAVHLRPARGDRLRPVQVRPAATRRAGPGAADLDPAAAPSGAAGIGGGGAPRRADEFAVVRVQLLLHADHLGHLQANPPRGLRAEAGAGGATLHRAAGGPRAALDPDDEADLGSALPVPAERAGLHRPAHRGRLSAGPLLSALQRRRGHGLSVDGLRLGAGPADRRAVQGRAGGRLATDLRQRQLLTLRRAALHRLRHRADRRQLADASAAAGAGGRADPRAVEVCAGAAQARGHDVEPAARCAGRGAVAALLRPRPRTSRRCHDAKARGANEEGAARRNALRDPRGSNRQPLLSPGLRRRPPAAALRGITSADRRLPGR